MGRRRKYFSDIERRDANNEKVKQFYWRNKNKLDGKAKAYYWKKKIINALEKGYIMEADSIKQKAIQKGIDEQLLIIEETSNDNTQ
jgi:hypothetical protein